MRTNSPSNITNDRASNGRLTAAPGHGRTFLWLALPLALAAGCASNPSRTEVTENFPDVPPPVTAPVSDSQTNNNNIMVGNEIYEMLLANRDIGNYLMATADDGVVVLSGAVTTRAERGEIDELTRELGGVHQVKDELNYETVPAGFMSETRH